MVSIRCPIYRFLTTWVQRTYDSTGVLRLLNFNLGRTHSRFPLNLSGIVGAVKPDLLDTTNPWTPKNDEIVGKLKDLPLDSTISRVISKYSGELD